MNMKLHHTLTLSPHTHKNTHSHIDINIYKYLKKWKKKNEANVLFFYRKVLIKRRKIFSYGNQEKFFKLFRCELQKRVNK